MTVLIIGGSGGVGAALARRVAARGAHVHLVGRREAPLADLAAELGGGYSTADVMDGAALKAAVLAAGPDLAGLAYCVGSIRLKPLSRLTDAEVTDDFRLNAGAAALAVQAALPALKAGDGGSVVLFSTVAVGQGFANHAAVAMAKGAVEGLVRALAAELAPKIRVNAIAPSLTRTPLAAGMTGSPQIAAAIAAAHPLQRLGEAEDIAAAADFLLGPTSGWVTGQIWGVDGGRSIGSAKG